MVKLVKVKKRPKITIKLNKEEAEFLVAILYKVAGDSKGPRGISDEMLKVLIREAGVDMEFKTRSKYIDPGSPSLRCQPPTYQ